MFNIEHEPERRATSRTHRESDMKRKLPGARSIRCFDCRKCGVNTSEIGEYYGLRTELWQGVVDRWKMQTDKFGQAGMLCVLCFENLLGRALTSEDFVDCPLNDENRISGSTRLQQRLRPA
jgi:hypothetical protein